MSSRIQQPLYTTVPWSPSDFYPKDQHITEPKSYPYPTIISPVDYQAQQFPLANNPNPFTATLQTEPTFISPITPTCVAPAPTPVTGTLAYPDQNQITYPQYPTQSAWSTCSKNHQLLTPQYPFFPSTIFTYPQPLPPQQFSSYPQHDINLLPHYNTPINYNINTQQSGNATSDLYQDNTAFAYAYSTSFGSTPHHDMFQHHSQYQHEALAPHNNGSIGTEVVGDGYKVRWEVIDPALHPKGINQSIPIQQSQLSIIDANSINNIDQNTSRNSDSNSHIFRSDKSRPRSAETFSSIDPALSSWGDMGMGGKDQRTIENNSRTIIDPEHDRISAIPAPISNSSLPAPPGRAASSHEQEKDGAKGYDDNSSPTKRGRWSTSSLPLFSRKSTTTPLRKRRPPQLHLPPPSASMRLPIANTVDTAPAASFSLDLFVPPDTITVTPQEPPPVLGWVSPDERPVPPLGYTVPGSESVPKIFEYGSENDIAAVPVAEADTHIPPDALPVPTGPLPTFQYYEPKAIPRATSNPQLRIPTTSPPSPDASYMIVPGVNGFEVAYLRPQIRTHARYPDAGFSSSLPIPPTTAAPWEVSVPPMDPFLPPSTASSWESISTLSDHYIPQTLEAEPVVYLNHELRNRGKTKSLTHPPRYHAPHPEKKETWAICEVCGATISRTSDLQRHMRKHTGEKPYHCPYCTSSYARNDKLSGHILKNHPGKPRVIHRAKVDGPTSSNPAISSPIIESQEVK